MNQIDQAELDREINSHLTESMSSQDVVDLCQRFRRHGFIKVPKIVPPRILDAVKQEAVRLLDLNAERRDLKLATTDFTPRKMSVVRSEIIAENSPLLNALYQSEPLLKFLAAIAREQLFSCPSKDEEFLISRHEVKGDTHGWHWGDFSFALIWILETPPIEVGGMLQCIPHTDWDKSNPQIHKYLCENQITTYGFVSGDIYFLRTDTTLHRTVPLNKDATRIMLNLTWASAKDLSRELVVDDRWWERKDAEAAVAEVEPAVQTSAAVAGS